MKWSQGTHQASRIVWGWVIAKVYIIGDDRNPQKDSSKTPDQNRFDSLVIETFED